MTRYVFLQNAASGDQDAGQLRRSLRSHLQFLNVDHIFIHREGREALTDTLNRATRELHHRDDTLVAVGGDGTINMAAAAALEGDFALGIIPAGTFNFVARTHGIPEDPSTALSLLLDTPPRPAQAALVNDKTFMVNASVGLYAKLLREREKAKRMLGRNRLVAALAAIYTALRPYRSFRIALSGDGQEASSRAATFIVGNNRLQLDLIGVDPAPSVGRGELFGAMLHPTGRFALLGIIRRGLRGEVGDTPTLNTFTLQSLTVSLPSSRRRKVRLAVDGELLRMQLPLTFAVDPRPLRLVHPPLGPLPAGDEGAAGGSS